MDCYSWITDLLVPGACFFFGLLWKSHPPKEINEIYGYRTSRSMTSQEAWDYAHKLCGKAWLISGLIMATCVTLSKLFIPMLFSIDSTHLSMYHMVFEISSLCVPPMIVEKRLAKKFDEHGQKK